MPLLLLVAFAHAAAPTPEQCATVVRNQAAWSGQSGPTDLDAQQLCHLAAAGAIPRSDLAQLVSCYADATTYEGGRCATLRTRWRACTGSRWVRTR
jgi:hypothetical protein